LTLREAVVNIIIVGLIKLGVNVAEVIMGQWVKWVKQIWMSHVGHSPVPVIH